MTIHEYIRELLSALDTNFPNTTRKLVIAGDDIRISVFELKENNAILRFKPYELYVASNDDYSESIKIQKL